MSVLITGASGSICKHLSHKLQKNDFEVKFLTANLNKTSEKQNIYYWNIDKREIDDRAFEGVNYIVHLAGAGIANQSWTKERKRVLVQSRVGGAALLLDTIKRLNKTIKKYISAGAIGIFDENCMNANEQSAQGSDFMATLCKEWENTIIPYQEHGISTTLFRSGIVIDQSSGFYEQIAKLAKYYIAAVPGSGKQWVSWISKDDMVDMYFKSITDDSVQGIYNATAPNPVQLKEMIKRICQNENRPLFLPNIPAFILKLIFGEMAQVILSSKHVIPSKWVSENRGFEHKLLSEALNMPLNEN
jgi:uncharacterized protein (TIGR01777 family)